jgi:hypothetical protein
MVKWTDFAALFCLALTMMAVAALVTAAQNFVIVRGKVVSIGSALMDSNDGKVPTRTVTVVIENDDRVFRIKSGTAVEYAVSDNDATRLRTGEEVELMLFSHQSKARVVNVWGRP